MSGRQPNSPIHIVWSILWICCACATGPTAHRVTEHPDSLYHLTLPGSGGGLVRLERCRGQVMMIDFFATWSQPSQLAVPGYAGLDRKYAGKGLCIIGVALDSLGDNVVAPFVAGMQIPYPVALADQNILSGRSIFGPIDAIPTTMLFDRQGRLARVFFGLVPIEELDRAIRHLL